MALQNTGSISMSQVKAEHGGTSPDSASEYYRKPAGLVDDQGTTSTSTTIPGNPNIGCTWSQLTPCCFTANQGVNCARACTCAPFNFCLGCGCSMEVCLANGVTGINPSWTFTTTTTTPANTNVPTAGTISWSDWYGSQNYP